MKERQRQPALRIAPSVISHLINYGWPGNMRELENVIERMVVLAGSDEITEADLPEEIRRVPVARDSLLLELPEEGISLEAVERDLLLRALEKFNWNQTQAARFLDISRRTLIYRMEKYALRDEGDPQ
jgi:DNA-binding NtrC family response regulator